jgi:hypothetical protein
MDGCNTSDPMVLEHGRPHIVDVTDPTPSVLLGHPLGMEREIKLRVGAGRFSKRHWKL